MLFFVKKMLAKILNHLVYTNREAQVTISLANSNVMSLDGNYTYSYWIDKHHISCNFDIRIKTTSARSAGSPAFRFMLDGQVIGRVGPNALTCKTNDTTIGNTWLLGAGWYNNPVQWNANAYFQVWGTVILYVP